MYFELIWIFRNNHEWHKNFETLAEREYFMNTCGLLTHPDIESVIVKIGQCSSYLKQPKKEN